MFFFVDYNMFRVLTNMTLRKMSFSNNQTTSYFFQIVFKNTKQQRKRNFTILLLVFDSILTNM